MRPPKLKKKYLIGALAVGVVMAGGGIAAAVFSASGSGKGAGIVGTAPTALSVTGVSVTPPTLTPPSTSGTNSQVLTFSVTNPNSFPVSIVTATSHATLGVGTTTDVVNYTTAVVPGCEAAWFTLTTTPSFSTGTIAAGESVTAFVTLSMPYTTATQDACGGIHGPKVTLTVKAVK